MKPMVLKKLSLGHHSKFSPRRSAYKKSVGMVRYLSSLMLTRSVLRKKNVLTLSALARVPFSYRKRRDGGEKKHIFFLPRSSGRICVYIRYERKKSRIYRDSASFYWILSNHFLCSQFFSRFLAFCPRRSLEMTFAAATIYIANSMK